MTRITASDLACTAIGIKPLGEPHVGHSTHCSFCAKTLHEGDLCTPFEPAKTFTDTLKTFPSGLICGACAAVTADQKTLRNFQRVVITREGIYPIGKDSHRSWLWLTPPEPPFAVVINHSTLGAYHFVWRTPVTLSKELICANIDDTLYWIDHGRLMKAVQVCNELLQAMSELKLKGAAIWKSPSRQGSSNGHGQLTAAVFELVRLRPELRSRVQFLQSLDAGIWIALASIIKKTPVDPEKPPVGVAD